MDDSKVDIRSTPPPPGTVVPYSFPRFEHFRLPPGLEVYLASVDRGPLVGLHLACPGGAWHDSPQQAGRATLAADLMDEGTDEMTAMDIATRVENLGGFLSAQADWNAGWLSMSLLSRHLEAGLELISRLVVGANFPDDEVARLRRERLAELTRRVSQPASLASDALARALFEGTAYGQSLLGTPGSVEALGREELHGFRCHHVTPRGSVLIVVGDLDTRGVRGVIERTFGSWSGNQPPIAEGIRGRTLERTEVIVVDRPQAAQTVLRIGHASIRRSDPDYGPLQVLNSLLGGKFTSRVNLSLREKLGITYGASSSFSGRLGPGPFVIAADVETAGVGIGARQIIDELRRLQEELVETRELQETKTYLLGVFPYSLQRVDGLASRLAELGIAGLPDDYFDRQLEVIRDIDPPRIRSLARHHLHPGRLAVVAVGPAESLRPQLESLGPMTVVSPEEVVAAAHDHEDAGRSTTGD